MERVRQITLVAVLVTTLGGCMTTDRLSANYHEARRAVGLDAASGPPATQLSLIMQRRLKGLPDPTRPDQQQYGLPGQMFLIGADGRAAAADGDLVVTVIDETPRSSGQSPKTTEKWHFTPDVLPRLRVKDERFGDCYVLFLPWPAGWQDVTRVTVRANFKNKTAGAVELHAQEVTINLDLGSDDPRHVQAQWEKLGAAKPPASSGQSLPVAPQSPPTAPALLPPPSQTPVVPQLQTSPAPPAIPGTPHTIVVPRN